MTCQPATLEILRFDKTKRFYRRRNYSIKNIKAVVAEHFEISVEQMMEKRRFQSIVFPRQVAMYLMYQHGRLNYSRTAEAFDNDDHTFAIAAVKACRRRMEVEPEFKEKVQQIIMSL